MLRITIFFLFLSNFLFLYPVRGLTIELYRKHTFSLSLHGSYKSLLTIGTTTSREDFWSDLNRLRFDVDLAPGESLLIKTIYDNELIIGSLLKKGEFLIAKKQREDTLYDTSKNIIDNPDLFWRHALYRFYLNYSRERFNLTIGRQRVAWGQARIWNPTDLFNPISPLQIESDQRTGVDAVNLEYSTGSLSSINIVYAPGDVNSKSSKGVRLRTNIKGYDLSMLLGEFREEKVFGFDFAGNIRDSGFRGEGVFTDKKEEKDFIRFVLSWDYNFPNTLYILLEYLYNGDNLGKGTNITNIRRFSGEITTRNINFLATHIGYDLTPLIRLNLSSIYDIDGGSIFLNPGMTYNLMSNLDWIIGIQQFSGNKDSEFGNLSTTYFTSIEWFF